MFFALIYPDQRTPENYMETVQISETRFDVAPPLFWKEGGKELLEGVWAYDDVNDRLVQIAEPELPTENVLNNVSGTQPNVII